MDSTPVSQTHTLKPGPWGEGVHRWGLWEPFTGRRERGSDKEPAAEQWASGPSREEGTVESSSQERGLSPSGHEPCRKCGWEPGSAATG